LPPRGSSVSRQAERWELIRQRQHVGLHPCPPTEYARRVLMQPSREAPREQNGNPAGGDDHHKAEGEECEHEEVRDRCYKLPNHELPADIPVWILSVVLDGVCHDDSPVSRHVRGAFGPLPKVYSSSRSSAC